MHSAVTQEVKAIEAEKLSVHAVCEKLASGQLLLLGSIMLVSARSKLKIPALVPTKPWAELILVEDCCAKEKPAMLLDMRVSKEVELS